MGIEHLGQTGTGEDSSSNPCIQLLARATEFVKSKGAIVDRNRDVKIRAAGKWAVHVESSKRILEDWKEIHAKHNLQYAVATDGGRQLDDTSEPVAASAAFTHEGAHNGRRLDANGMARSSYETELQALIDVLEE